jgi:cation diffusion facilitator family transporter
MAGNTGEVYKSLVVNAVIASAKGVAAFTTGSGAMLAETLHSFADCGNQLLLLLGIKQSARPPDDKHPLGYGRAMYFYSFVVAMLLFSGGGVFSIYEGIHKLEHPEPVGDVKLALAILGFSLALEGWSTWGNLRVMKEHRADKRLVHYLRDSKDSDLVVVFGENSAAVLGLVLAGIALVAAKVTNDGRWDAIGSLAIGGVLAIFLARKITSLLLGESADPKLEAAIQQLAVDDPNVETLLRLLTIQQGPNEIVAAMKLKFRDGLDTKQLVDAINAFEVELQKRVPEVRWSFIEPDHVD